MSVTRKALMRMACVREGTPGTYTAPSVELPFTSQDVNQEWETIADNSIVGVAFKDIPAQGVRGVRGPLEVQADLDTMSVLLKAGFGYLDTGVYTMPADKNEEALSFVRLDGVKTNKYAGCFLNNFAFKSSAKEDAKISADVLGYRVETRDDTAFPAMSTTPGTRILHHHADSIRGSGYVRIGTQDDALAAGDNVFVKEINFGVNWQFDFDYYNGIESLIPLSGQAGTPETTFSMIVNRHETDNYKTWVDARTALQAEILYYASATKTMLIRIPNFILTGAPISGDDVPSVELKTVVGRNGTGTSYDNANMEFVSPIQVTITNS